MNNIKLTDKLINGKNVLEINLNTLQQYIVLVYNHLKDKENEQHTNITLIGNINHIYDSYAVDFKSICVELLNKSQSYTINIEKNLFKNNLDYFEQSHIINNKRYHSISRFTNSNAINDVYLVCGTDDHRLINYKGKDNQKSYERAKNEIKSMKLLKYNRRFVQLVDYHHDKDNQIFHIITEYCDGGDLSQKYKHLTDINLIFSESYISNYISQLFNILLDLDKHGIVHCDIKPSNIFIHELDDYGTLILGDFGCCKFIDKSTIIEYQDTKEHTLETNDFNSKTIDHEISVSAISNINATRGTIGYISPEAMKRQYAQSCDIFSIGSTILKLLCCHPDDRNNHQLFQSTKREIKISECRYSKQLIEFIHRLLDQSPKNRESLNQILNQYIETNTNNKIITFNLNTPFHNTSVNVTEINFGYEFNQILSIGVLPESLESLVFGRNFNQILSVGVLPESLKSLKFGFRFNQILSVGVLPESLKSLIFGIEFNQILSVGVLPESLESLVFGNRFNQILSVGVLPESLKSLVFGIEFNQILSVGVLPESLYSLKFGRKFNQILSVGVLPESLESLKFGRKFNQILSVGVLPESLKSLVFGYEFNQILSVGVLPESLYSLKFGWEFNQILSVGVLPESLYSLKFGWKFNQILSVGVLPESLESLEFGCKFNQILSVGVLPESIESLEFGYYFNQILSVGVLPKSLESLVFGNGFNQKLSVGVLPESLKSLSMTNYIDRKDLPQHIENLFIRGQRIDIDSF
ncbi:FNIP repeat-containing protein [Heterostelium album PN500]|uniref:FNIP repeat-containing protein n=1 Tax=Heterostelium pallidum (strain ATCC 26659 / Pp 5 / PN500) TaxID=670386 RepID=D3BLJ2_HETP5|nr:FNIP repeat-containing protein [Heterostelium album PN500]EFA77443.1 FNIP repeat-containing protein [Heterostelium album PN500]|eukprot:XP_020429571.1 FNIP repeat-containing protein [Heterostelium album PN500]